MNELCKYMHRTWREAVFSDYHSQFSSVINAESRLTKSMCRINAVEQCIDTTYVFGILNNLIRLFIKSSIVLSTHDDVRISVLIYYCTFAEAVLKEHFSSIPVTVTLLKKTIISTVISSVMIAESVKMIVLAARPVTNNEACHSQYRFG